MCFVVSILGNISEVHDSLPEICDHHSRRATKGPYTVAACLKGSVTIHPLIHSQPTQQQTAQENITHDLLRC